MDTKTRHPLASSAAFGPVTRRLQAEPYEVRVAFWAQAEREVISHERAREAWRHQRRDQDPTPGEHWSTFEQLLAVAREAAVDEAARDADPRNRFIRDVVGSQTIAMEIASMLDEVRSAFSRSRDDPRLETSVNAIEQRAFDLSQRLNTALDHLRA